ncbi:MAG: radical SAM protein [Candidatus Micrarchaeia archaeon]
MKIRYASIVDFDGDAYPGRNATVLRLTGCPLNCVYCPARELAGEAPFDEKPVEYFAEHLSKVMHSANALVVTGGEPLMQGNALEDLLALAKQKGFAIKLETPGYYAETLNDLLPNLDYVSIDLKAAFDAKAYASACGFKGDAGLLLSNVLRSLTFLEKRGRNVYKEFTVTAVPGFTDSPSVIEGLAAYVAPFADRFVVRCPASGCGCAPVGRERLAELAAAAKRHVECTAIEG